MTFERLTFGLIVALVAEVAAATDLPAWPQWGGPKRDFVARSAARVDAWPSSGPREIWRRSLGSGDSTIVSDGPRLFTLYRKLDHDVAIALDATTGKTLWEYSWSSPNLGFMALEFGSALHSTPALGGGVIIAIGGAGRLVALDANTGALRWSRDLWEELDGTRLERGYAASPIIYRDLVVTPVGGRSGALVAFRLATGQIAWQSPPASIAYSSPILARVGDQDQIVALLDEELLAVDPVSGALLWRHLLRRYRYVNTATPVQDARGRIFVNTSDGGRLLEVRPVGSGFEIDEIWVERSIGSQVGNVIVLDGHLYGVKGGSTSFLVSVDLETGQTNWRERSIGDSNLVLANGKLIVLEDGGLLHLLDASPERVQALSSEKVLSGRAWSAPTLVGGRLYLRDRHEIVALDLTAGSS